MTVTATRERTHRYKPKTWTDNTSPKDKLAPCPKTGASGGRPTIQIGNETYIDHRREQKARYELNKNTEAYQRFGELKKDHASLAREISNNKKRHAELKAKGSPTEAENKELAQIESKIKKKESILEQIQLLGMELNTSSNFEIKPEGKLKAQAKGITAWFKEKWRNDIWGKAQAILAGLGLSALSVGAATLVVNIIKSIFGGGNQPASNGQTVSIDQARQLAIMAYQKGLAASQGSERAPSPTGGLTNAGNPAIDVPPTPVT